MRQPGQRLLGVQRRSGLKQLPLMVRGTRVKAGDLATWLLRLKAGPDARVDVARLIMLLNLGHASEINDARGLGWKLAAGLVGLALLAQVFALTRAQVPEKLALPENTVANQVACAANCPTPTFGSTNRC